MRYRLAAGTLILAGILVTGINSVADAVQITINSVTGSGSYNNSPELLINGVIPGETTTWSASTNVWWYGTLPKFTMQFDAAYRLEDLLVQVDHNDNYLIEYSLNGSDWAALYTISSSDGNVNSAGMDTFIPSEINFSPVDAQYLRLSAVSGDNMYAISEVQAFGTSSVPEPASLLLLGSGLFAMSGYRKQKESN